MNNKHCGSYEYQCLYNIIFRALKEFIVALWSLWEETLSNESTMKSMLYFQLDILNSKPFPSLCNPVQIICVNREGGCLIHGECLISSYSLVCNRLDYQAICQVLLHKSPKVAKECYQNVELATQGTFMQHPVCTYTCHNQITLCS